MTVINKRLQPHQQEAADFFIKVYKTYNGALCSDEMGLGKSLMSLYVAFKITESKKHPILIVSPLSAQSAWREQLAHNILMKRVSINLYIQKQLILKN